MLRAILITTATILAGCVTATAPPAASSAGHAAARQPLPPCPAEATRIASKDCGPGRTYDQNTLRSTGQTQPGAALNQLDPTVVVQ